jgi:SAM-dependent methyltransferase
MLNLITKTGEICQNIAKEDDMYAGNKNHYFGVGESALKNIIISLNLANKENCLSILDMPSGYGRELRYLKAQFPEANITACELDRKAVDFCVKTFNVKGIYSDKNIKNLKIEDKFDLIWCGSLFTHLDKDLWPSFFKFFYDHLEEKGILIFTIHGKYVAERMINGIYDYGIPKEKIPVVYNSYIKTGFGYASYPNNNEYGISISSPSWIFPELGKFKGFRIILFSEQSWDNHQDVIACIKEEE